MQGGFDNNKKCWFYPGLLNLVGTWWSIRQNAHASSPYSCITWTVTPTESSEINRSCGVVGSADTILPDGMRSCIRIPLMFCALSGIHIVYRNRTGIDKSIPIRQNKSHDLITCYEYKIKDIPLCILDPNVSEKKKVGFEENYTSLDTKKCIQRMDQPWS